MLDVDGCVDIDPAVQQLLDILPALGMGGRRAALVCASSSTRTSAGGAGEDRVQVHLLERAGRDRGFRGAARSRAGRAAPRSRHGRASRSGTITRPSRRSAAPRPGATSHMSCPRRAKRRGKSSASPSPRALPAAGEYRARADRVRASSRRPLIAESLPHCRSGAGSYTGVLSSVLRGQWIERAIPSDRPIACPRSLLHASAADPAQPSPPERHA